MKALFATFELLSEKEHFLSNNKKNCENCNQGQPFIESTYVAVLSNRVEILLDHFKFTTSSQQILVTLSNSKILVSRRDLKKGRHILRLSRLNCSKSIIYLSQIWIYNVNNLFLVNLLWIMQKMLNSGTYHQLCIFVFRFLSQKCWLAWHFSPGLTMMECSECNKSLFKHIFKSF